MESRSTGTGGRADDSTEKPPHSSWRFALLGSLGLVVAIGLVYAPLRHSGFVRIDDPHYVSGNALVLRGLTLEGLSWAWTTIHASNWHPLTWWSHMLDAQLFGADPVGHHATSLGLHVLDTLLLWLAFARLTGAPGRSWVVAALFALHPLHVESVAWVAERKDVLSTLFLALVLLAYERFGRAPSALRMASVALFLALGLLCKPMLVTVPFVLLLLDAWPLQRGLSWARVAEKWPLFLLAAASCSVTFVAQHEWGSVASMEEFSLSQRIGDALIAYVAYLRLALWPADLCIHYPHALGLRWRELAAATAVLAAVTFIAWRERRRRPYVLIGWLWFLGTLVPVIGLVQVGSQAMADRYTYWTLLGPFVAGVWFAAEAFERMRANRVVVVATAIGILTPLSLAAHRQVGVWRDSLTLFEHAVVAEPRSELAHQSLGDELVERGRVDAGIAELRIAIELAPNYEVAHNGLGVALQARGELALGIEELRRATEIAPDYFEAWINLGSALHEANDIAGAAHAFEQAVALRPWHYEAQFNLAYELASLGRLAPAREHCRKAALLAPAGADDHRRLAALAEVTLDPELARAQLELVLRLDPLDGAACERALALATQSGDRVRAAELALQLERIRSSSAKPGAR